MLPLVYTFLLLAALSFTEASPLKFDLKKPSANARLAERAVSDDVVSADGLYYYFADLEIGTPGQSVTVTIDTGSFNLIVDNCTSGGCYTPDLSSTSVLRSNTVVAGEYADGSSYSGYSYNDTISWGDLSLDDFLLVSGSVSDGSSIMGISYYASDTDQYNFVDQLYVQGNISRRVFNLYKNIDGTDGGIVFGGLNAGKYEGSLETVSNIGPGYGFYIAVTGVSTDCGYFYESIDAYIIDTGSQLTYVPEGLFHNIHQQFGGVQASPVIDGMFDNSYMFKCKNAETVYFDFSGKKIAMEPSSFLLPLTDVSGATFTDADGDDMCTTSIASDLGSLALGANLLPNMFVVFDAESGEVSIAQASADGADGADDLVEITGDIPDASYASLVSEITDTSAGPSDYPTPTTSTLSETVGFALAEYTGSIDSGCLTSSSGSSSSSSSFSDKLLLSTVSMSTTLTYNVGTCLQCSTSTSSSSSSSSTSTTSLSTSFVTVSTSTTLTYNVGTCFECSTSTAPPTSVSSTTTDELSATIDTITSCSGGCTTTLSPPALSTSSLDISSSTEATTSSSSSSMDSTTFSSTAETSSSTSTEIVPSSSTSSEIVIVTPSSSVVFSPELMSSSTLASSELKEPSYTPIVLSSTSSESTSSSVPVPTTPREITSYTLITSVFTTDSTVVTLTTTVPCTTEVTESTTETETTEVPETFTTSASVIPDTECVPSTTVVTITTEGNYLAITTTIPCEAEPASTPESTTITTLSPEEPSSVVPPAVLSSAATTSSPVVPEIVTSQITSTEEDSTITIKTQITIYSSATSVLQTPAISTAEEPSVPSVSTYNGGASMITGSLVLFALPFLF